MRNFTEIFNDEHIKKLRNQLFFSGLSDYEIYLFIVHSRPIYVKMNKGENLRIAEKYGHRISLVYSGEVNSFSVEYDGNKNLLSVIDADNNSYIEYAAFDYSNSHIEFKATVDSEILLIDPVSVLIGEDSIALIQQKILANMMAAQRWVFQEFSDHISCLTQRSIRDKVLKFLKIYSEKVFDNEFDIRFSRDELAVYLAVDRAALSRTLGELKREGIIDFRKNHFVLLK